MVDLFSQDREHIMKDLIPFNTRVINRDGQLIYQRRLVFATIKNVWYKPWTGVIDYHVEDWYDVPVENTYTFRVGDRVQVKQTAGFHKGATGEVNFIEPSGKVWVTRDNSGSPVYYHNDELTLIWRRPNE